MPRIWLDYCQFLVGQGRITRTRRTFDRALRALPITQHHRLWPLYLRFVRLYPLPETAVRVYRRYLKVRGGARGCPGAPRGASWYPRVCGGTQRYLVAPKGMWGQPVAPSGHPVAARSSQYHPGVPGGTQWYTGTHGGTQCAQWYLGAPNGAQCQNPHNVHEWHKRVRLHHGDPQQVGGAPGRRGGDTWGRRGEGRSARIPQNGHEGQGACERAPAPWRPPAGGGALGRRGGDTVPAVPDAPRSPIPTSISQHPPMSPLSPLSPLSPSNVPNVPLSPPWQSTKAVYERILDLRIATPQIVINYGLFLEERGYFEESFKAYERGIALFRWPNVAAVWHSYLTKFVARYGGRKLERARDLFEQALDGCPQKYAKTIYLLYAKLEEEFGLARHAMAVYERATRAVLPAEQRDMFNIYIKRAAELYGVTHTRPIYEKAIEVGAATGVPETARCHQCPQGLTVSPSPPPQITANFWQTWKDFEIRHGNEDTIREMLRIKRSVQATYNTQVNFMASQMLKVYSNATGTGQWGAPMGAGEAAGVGRAWEGTWGAEGGTCGGLGASVGYWGASGGQKRAPMGVWGHLWGSGGHLWGLGGTYGGWGAPMRPREYLWGKREHL
uniref:Suppressor of forked domain-containing protein n=1 Tax=Cairina moschata TaxID=8855 RepID=A0A8C3C600_CAIMO